MVIQEEFQLDGRKVQIAVPSYTNKVSFEWVAAMKGTQSAAAEYGCEVVVDILCGSSLLANSRTELATNFIESDADTLFFIDDDVVWEPDDALRMIAWTSMFDCVAGVYCHRQDPPKFTARFQKTQKNQYIQNQFGLLRTDHVPGGFLTIRKEPLKKVNEQFSNLSCILNEGKEDEKTGVALWMQYISKNDEGKPVLYGEDIAFCNRWREAGFEIWVDPYLKLTHQGTKNYSHQIQNSLFTKKIEKDK